jgi:hypothetical protein
MPSVHKTPNGLFARKEANGGGGEFKYDIFDIVRTFVNATMYPHPALQLKKEKRKET